MKRNSNKFHTKAFCGALFFLFCSFNGWAQTQIKVGAERMDMYLPMLEGKRVALVVNHSSKLGSTHLLDTLLAAKICIARIFLGAWVSGTADAGEKVSNDVDLKTGIPIVSLYGRHKKPRWKDLEDVDLVLFDIQDVGARFYTYISTLFYVEQACADFDLPLMVLDRPNPNGHYVDGPLLESNLHSFVGIVPIPIVHGCTIGELATMFAGEGFIENPGRLKLTIIPCENYTHQTPYELPIPPSPNLPNARSIYLYPSLCLFEGTSFSIGRGTDTPFQVLGHPDLPVGDYYFTPCPNEGSKYPKHEEIPCRGYDLTQIPIDSLREQGRIDLHWLLDMYCEFPDKETFFNANRFFDLLAGTRYLREQIELGSTEEEIRESWVDGLNFYRLVRQQYLLYPE
ncbi:MAG: DUF1343 domain-containing protein [Saprospiraceae bacterium]